MKKHILKIISLLLVLFIVSGVAVAAEGTVQPLASDYLISCSAYISHSDGKSKVNFTARATSLMTSLGVTQIQMQWSYNGTAWNDGETIDLNDEPSMLGSNKSIYISSVPFSGVEGRYYRAKVTFYASNSSGSDSATITTQKVLI